MKDLGVSYNLWSRRKTGEGAADEPRGVYRASGGGLGISPAPCPHLPSEKRRPPCCLPRPAAPRSQPSPPPTRSVAAAASRGLDKSFFRETELDSRRRVAERSFPGARDPFAWRCAPEAPKTDASPVGSHWETGGNGSDLLGSGTGWGSPIGAQPVRRSLSRPG